MDPRSTGAPAHPRRRRRRSWLRRLVVAAALIDLGTVAVAPALASAAGPFSLQVTGNQAAFQVTALKPGPVGQRCLVLQAVNGAADLALLSASVGGTGLGAYLDVVIERGPAAGAGSCATMATTALFGGTLDQLALAHPSAASGLTVPFDAPTSDAALRITVSLRDDNAAQGRNATAVFAFQADDTTVAPPPTVPPTTASATTVPASARTTTVGAGPIGSDVGATTSTSAVVGPVTTPATTPVSRPAVAAPSTAPRGTASASGGGRTTTTGPGRATGSSSPAAIAVSDPSAPGDGGGFWPTIPQAVRTTVTLTARASTVPATFLVLVFVFLVLQDRIDRNDPKLARAPLRPEPELLFLPRGEVAR